MLNENLKLKTIDPNSEEEILQAIEIEQTEFPPNEACSSKDMRERATKAYENFLIAYIGNEVVGYLNGLPTNEEVFRDEFFTDINLYDKNGKNVMLLGLAVKDKYKMNGIAKAIMLKYIEQEKSKGRKRMVLTCLPRLVEMYKKFGFKDLGISNSVWGGESWHDMEINLDETR